MKLLNLATIALLSTSVLAGGTVAFAEEARDVKTEGQIKFVPNDGELTVVDPPEITEPPVVIPPTVPGTTGPLTIAYAPTMNFGEQVISAKDMSYDMMAEMQELADESGSIPYVSFAQVQDTRGTNAGWDLQVSLSDFRSATTTQNDVLTGAQIQLSDGSLNYVGNIANAPTLPTSIVLNPGSGAVPVMTAADGKGAGTSSIVWGNQEDLNAQFADDAVEDVTNSAIQLSVPGSTAKDAVTYVSTLSWELTTTPDEDGETEVDPEA